jgi:hypothetical protein
MKADEKEERRQKEAARSKDVREDVQETFVGSNADARRHNFASAGTEMCLVPIVQNSNEGVALHSLNITPTTSICFHGMQLDLCWIQKMNTLLRPASYEAVKQGLDQNP